MLTASPVCNQGRDIFKDNYLLFDRLFIDYTSVSSKGCVSTIDWVLKDAWFKLLDNHPRPEIWFIFSASPEAVGYYMDRKSVKEIIKVCE